MKKIMLGIFLLFSLITNTSAGLNCSTDSWGNTTCYGTGEDSGYSLNSSTDSWGNTTIYDNQGSTTNCSTDSWGNTSCY